jgi:hypothetical protein
MELHNNPPPTDEIVIVISWDALRQSGQKPSGLSHHQWIERGIGKRACRIEEDSMATSGGQKFVTLSQVAPGATVGSKWNNANAEVYNLHAWPVVSAGVDASAEITKSSFVVHGNPSERELHFWVKNTGTTQVDIAVWGFWWNA